MGDDIYTVKSARGYHVRRGTKYATPTGGWSDDIATAAPFTADEAREVIAKLKGITPPKPPEPQMVLLDPRCKIEQLASFLLSALWLFLGLIIILILLLVFVAVKGGLRY